MIASAHLADTLPAKKAHEPEATGNGTAAPGGASPTRRQIRIAAKKAANAAGKPKSEWRDFL